MGQGSWKKCRQCGRKQSVRHIGILCGKCEAADRRKKKRQAKKVG